MRHLSLLLLLLGSRLGADYTMTLTPEAGGAQTRVSWDFTGDVLVGVQAGWTTLGVGAMSFGRTDASTQPALYPESFPTSTFQGSGNSYTEKFALTTTLTLTNLTTGTSVVAESILLMKFEQGWEFVAFDIMNAGVNNGLGFGPLTAGDIIKWSGETTGSRVIDQSYDTFNEGVWLWQQHGLGSSATLIVGSTPVPEPSTYGLILGALALAGAAVRRRKTSK